MNKHAHQFVDDIIKNAPFGDKDAVIKYVCNKYNLKLDRKVYYCKYFAIRFSYSKNGSFSNTVLSLSALQKYDTIPFFVILIRHNKNSVVYLANSTFISKISHSSKELSMTNIKGSFNGSDIIKRYNDLDNEPSNFDNLFALHQGLDWEDNLLRLVETSGAIIPVKSRFTPNEQQIANIENAPFRAAKFIQSNNFNLLVNDLRNRCDKCKDAILIASHIENVNIRGRLIEYMITANDDVRDHISSMIMKEKCIPEFDTRDELGDYSRAFNNGTTYIDIKTKILYLASAPKAYNIDKFLKKMSETESIFFFFLIGINNNGIFNTVLCSVFHNELIDASIVQHHWAGRATRGVVQFNGRELNKIIQNIEFKNVIDEVKATKYIK